MRIAVFGFRQSVPFLIACAVVTPLLQRVQCQTDPARLLSLVGAYVADYERQLAVVVGEEDYTQRALEPVQYVVPSNSQSSAAVTLRRRHLRSEFAILRLPTDEKQWTGFRDVFEVDGRTIPDRVGRLMALLKLPFGSAVDQWRALDEESSRFNIGSIRRTVNVPTFVLLFLRADNQRRFVFDAPHSDGADVVVAYREVTLPTFIRDQDGDDEPTRGFFRANAKSGAIVSTRLTVGLARNDVQAQIDVQFKVDRKLSLLVPAEMRERYVAPSGARVEAIARYRSFKRFEVDATWKVRP